MVMGYQLMMFIHITTLRISLSQIFNTSIGRGAGNIKDARREKNKIQPSEEIIEILL